MNSTAAAFAAVLTLAPFAAQAQSVSPAAPLFERQNGSFVVFAPQPRETATLTDPRFAEFGDRVIETLRDRALPEPLTVESYDPTTLTARVTTVPGVFEDALEMGVDVGPREPAAPARNCADFYVAVTLTPETTASPEAIIGQGGMNCQFDRDFWPHRELVVEGLDDVGAQLFTTISPDARFELHESLSPSGQLQMEGMGRTEAEETYVTFQAPIEPTLARIRVWEVDAEGAVTLISEVPWVNVELTP